MLTPTEPYLLLSSSTSPNPAGTEGGCRQHQRQQCRQQQQQQLTPRRPCTAPLPALPLFLPVVVLVGRRGC